VNQFSVYVFKNTFVILHTLKLWCLFIIDASVISYSSHITISTSVGVQFLLLYTTHENHFKLKLYTVFSEPHSMMCATFFDGPFLWNLWIFLFQLHGTWGGGGGYIGLKRTKIKFAR
jgi:hypothetical protein